MTHGDHARQDGMMSESDCSEALLRVYEYLDGEMSTDDCRKIQAHLDDCGPCLKQYNLDQALKAVIKRSCACEEAPLELRATILTRITMIRIGSTD
jgi:mycothiol system anti-sigma-R factor